MGFHRSFWGVGKEEEEAGLASGAAGRPPSIQVEQDPFDLL